MSHFIYKTKKNMIGRTYFFLKAEKFKQFKKSDVVYVSNEKNIIHSRWIVINKTEDRIALKKKPERTVSYNYVEGLSLDGNEKILELNDLSIQTIETQFVHKISIYPYYDIKTNNSELNDVLDEIKIKDLEVEIYTDVFTNNKVLYKNGFEDNYNLIISKKYGLITFKCLNDDIFSTPESFDTFKAELNIDPIFNSLTNSSILSEDGETLKVGYKKCFVFESSKPNEYYLKVNDTLEANGFKNQMVCNKEKFIEIVSQTLGKNNDTLIGDNEHFAIFQILMPQYINSKVTNINKDKIEFIPDQSYELDENQKDVLSQMSKRIFLKAAAGSGKTILLLAKAYEVAVANPNKLFMIVCYNSKLAEDIKIQAQNTGKMRANLKISTLDKFIFDNVTQYEPQTEEENKFEARRKIFVEKVYTKQYTQEFGGIFVDEMQQLMIDEDCILALLECLDENKYMVLAGDYYQQIRNESQDEIEDDFVDDNDNDNDMFYIGDYGFERVILDKNYRNTENITVVVNHMLKRINQYKKDLEIPLDYEEKNIIMGKSVRKGGEVSKYYQVQSEDEQINLIVTILRYLLVDKHYSQNEILLLSPGGNTDSWKDYSIYKLEQRIAQSGIKICDFGDRNNSLSMDGIRIGTIGRAIGLDFKAVIIFGTSMMSKTKNDKFKIGTLRDMKLQNMNIKKDFIKYLNSIYVACSRARDILVVVDDLKKSNLITEFLKIVGDNNER